MFVLISGYLGIWMDMTCVAFWKITVVLCSHMSLQWQEYSVFLMAQRQQWKAQSWKCVESCWTDTSTWLPQPGHKPWKNEDLGLKHLFESLIYVHYDTMHQNSPGILSQSFVQFLSYAMNSKCQVWSLFFLFTELVQTNSRASSVPTTHEFLDSDIMPRDLRAWREQRKQKQLEGEQVLYLMNQDMVASTRGGIRMKLKIRPPEIGTVYKLV